MRIRTALTAAAASSVLLLGACSSTESTGTAEEAPVGSNADVEESEPSQDEESPSEGASDEPVDDGIAEFGETYTFEDDIALTVSEPKPFKPSQYAATGNKFKNFQRFTVTVVNGSDVAYDPTMIYATMQSGDAEAEEVYDTQNGLEGSPQTKVLPGRQTKFDIGFGVKNPSDLVMEIAPGFEYDSVIFTNTM
jgi:hypothetical protein